LNWRWLFYLVLPLTAFSILFAAVYLKNVSDLTRPKVDILSIIISTIGFGGIVYGFSKAGGGSWSDPEVYWTIIIGGVSIVLFVWRQLKMEEPLLDLRAFKFPMFTLVVILLLVLMMTMFSTLTLLPQFLQSVLLMTALKSGLVMMPGSILNGIMAPVSGVLFDKFGPRVLVVPGLVLVVGALGMFMGIDTDTSTAYIITSHIIMLVGISLVMMPAQTTGLNQLPRHLYPHGTAILNTLQQVAGAVGTALFISIMASGTKKYLSESSDPTAPAEAANGLVAGLQSAFLVGFIVALVALVLGFFLKRTKAPEEEKQQAA